MRRNVQIICIAAAAVVVGGTLWAVASSDVLGRLGLTSNSATKEASAGQRGAGDPSRSGEKVAAVSVPKGAAAARRSAEPLAIEVAEIDAGGISVIAGRSPPNHQVVVLANGREIATTVATDEGQWAVIVSEGIASGPLELSVSAKPASGGPAIVTTAQQLVVPPSGGPSRVAEAPPAKVWAPPMAAGAQVPKPYPGKAAVIAAESRAKTASDKQALEQFAAIVERARTDAATETKSPSATAPGVAAGNPVLSAPKTVTADAAARATQVRATDALPDPAQVPIPVPITFMTDEVELTPDGSRAAALLAEYLRLKRPQGISLSGHADTRGADGYNMELSKRRLEAIERYLRQAGYTGNLSLTPKGKREPYLGIDRTRLSQQEVFQADRRVELRLTP